MIGERIRQRRVARGLSQRSLAELAGVSAMAISNYETGKDMPGSQVLLRLATVMHVGIDYFFRSITVQLGEPAYRKHSKLTASNLSMLESRILEKVERCLEAESLIEATSEASIPSESILSAPVENMNDVEERAEQLRKIWSIGDDPIGNLTELIEDHGIKVIYVEGEDGFDGLAYPDGQVPVIAVNSNVPGDRLRFDLAHELGHLLLRFPNTWNDKNVETAAHRFAGAFLVPRSAVFRELGERRKTISLIELRDLKAKYGVSMQAWIYRSKDLGVIADTASKSMWREFNRRGWKRNEPFPYPKEESRRHERQVMRAYVDRIISDSRAAELLSVSLADFAEMISSIEDTGPPVCATGSCA